MPGMRKKYMLGYAAGGMPRSPLMLPTLVPSQRPPRTYIHEMGPRFEGDNPRFNIPAPAPEPTPIGLNPDGTLYVSPLPSAAPGVPTGPDGQIGPANIPEENFNTPERFMGINDRPPIQYIGEGAPIMKMPPEIPQFPGRQPKFPGMMEPIRQPEPVGPLPMMPPVDNQTRTTEQLIRVPESELINQIRGDLPPPRRTYINEGAPRDITEEEILQIDPDYFKQPGDDRGFIPMPLDSDYNKAPTPTGPGTGGMPPGFTPPPADSFNSMAFVDYWNPTTGETWSAPSGGYTAPPGWEVKPQTGLTELPIGPGTDPTPTGPPMPPDVLNPDGTPPWMDPHETEPDGGPPGGPPIELIERMPPEAFPDEPEQTAQPTQDQFMERLMQMIQALQERSQPVAQPAPQPVQQMAPPPPRPPVAAFNMGNASAPMTAPTMPQMFNQGPGFFTPQQRGPRIAPGAIAQQGQEMPNYNLDFSSFLRNR